MTKTTLGEDARSQVLAEAAWAAHCWVVDRALGQEIQKMPPSDISYYIQEAIRNAKPFKN